MYWLEKFFISALYLYALNEHLNARYISIEYIFGDKTCPSSMLVNVQQFCLLEIVNLILYILLILNYLHQMISTVQHSFVSS